MFLREIILFRSSFGSCSCRRFCSFFLLLEVLVLVDSLVDLVAQVHHLLDAQAVVAKRPETVEVFNIFWDYLRYSTLLYVGGDAGLDFTVRYTNTIYKI